MESTDLAQHLDRLIGFGRYQIYLFLLYQYTCLTMVVNQAFMVFGAVIPNFRCLDATDSNASFSTNCSGYENCTDFEFDQGFHSIVVEVTIIKTKKKVSLNEVQVISSWITVGFGLFS